MSFVCQSNKAPCWTICISVTSDSLPKLAQQEVRSERSKELEHRAERTEEMVPRKTQRALDLATEKGSSAWFTVLSLQELGFNLNNKEFDSVMLLNYPHVLVGKPLRLRVRRVPCDIKNVDNDVEVVEGAIQSDCWCVSLLLNGRYSSLTHCERCLIFIFFSDLFFSNYLSKNAIDLENCFFFFGRNELF